LSGYNPLPEVSKAAVKDKDGAAVAKPVRPVGDQPVKRKAATAKPTPPKSPQSPQGGVR
jgi:hypothetical protein